MSEIKIGVVTDSHMGGSDYKISEALKREQVDVVAYLGDAPRRNNSSKQEQTGDLQETLQTYDKIGVPVFWIPGNYEDFDAYHEVFGDWQDVLDNVTDATRCGKYTLKLNGVEIDFVFVPGARDYSRGFEVSEEYSTGDYCLQNGSGVTRRVHIFNPHDLENLVANPEATVVLAHNPIKMYAENTFDIAVRAIYEGKEIAGPAAGRLVQEGKAELKLVHAGNELVGQIVDRLGVKKYLSGDIHRAIFTTDRQGNPIPAGTFSRELFGNPGPARDGRYGVLVYRDDRMATLYSKSVNSLEAVGAAKQRLAQL